MRLKPEFVSCSVEHHYTAWLIHFLGPNKGLSILIQTDYAQAQFAVDCSVVDGGSNWDGRPSRLPNPQQFYDLDVDRITQCPEYYLDTVECPESWGEVKWSNWLDRRSYSPHH